MPLECILFDIDGTLADTDHIHHVVFKEVLKPYGYDVDDAFYKAKISGRINYDIWKDFLPPHTADQEIEKMSLYKEDIYRERARSLLVPMGGLIPLLEEIKESGLKIGCVTNAPRGNVDLVMDVLNIRHYFQIEVLGDDCERGKPHPAPYLKALELFNVKAENTVAFEDSPAGMASSVAAKIRTIGVCSTQTPEALKKFGAEITIPDFTHISLEKLRNLF